MAASLLVDAGFLIALLSRADRYHEWAVGQASQYPPPWKTCDAVLSEAFHLLGGRGRPALTALIRKEMLISSFDSNAELGRVLGLMERYRDVPMSLADGCLVRMTELFSNHTLLTTDTDFQVYRRHGRQTIRAVLPG